MNYERCCRACQSLTPLSAFSSLLEPLASDFSAVYGVLSVIGNSLAGSVGNSISCESAEKNYHDLRKFQFLFSGLNIICTTCMVAMYQPFMQIWVGRRLMLSDRDMLLFCLYFYLINMNNIRNQYIDGTGMWNALKWSYILEAFGNLFLNIILGKLFGVTGILCATIFTIAILLHVKNKQHKDYNPRCIVHQMTS